MAAPTSNGPTIHVPQEFTVEGEPLTVASTPVRVHPATKALIVLGFSAVALFTIAAVATIAVVTFATIPVWVPVKMYNKKITKAISGFLINLVTKWPWEAMVNVSNSAGWKAPANCYYCA